MNKDRFDMIVNKYDLQGDGHYYRYEMLAFASQIAPDGIFVEIGFRAGTGMMAMIEGNNPSDTNLYVAIDPFGNIPYKEGKRVRHLDYTNARRQDTLKNFYSYLADNSAITNFIFFNLESIEFFNRYSDGIPDYFSGHKVIRQDYALVHLDGQHDTDTVLKEVQFFMPRVLSNGFIIIDNTEQGWMDMTAIESELFANGFTKHSISQYDKWAYIKQSMNTPVAEYIY